MASFNGIDLGLILECNTFVAPKERQINAAPGVDGLEILDLGGRGGETRIEGVIAGVDVFGLAAVKGVFRDLQFEGGAHTLIDHEFTEWTNVILIMFKPIGRRMLVAGSAGLAQRYEMEFLHTGD